MGSAGISPGQDWFSEVKAEGVGFEPTVTLPPLMVFKTIAIGH